MRRLLAITLVLLFGLPLAAPLFASDSASTLPECCRRNGRHHCAAAMTTRPASRQISTIAPKCPNWPKSTAAPAGPNEFAPSQTQGVVARIYASPNSAPQIQARYRVAYARSRQKRGPPAISL
jgi:hypothetical protein